MKKHYLYIVLPTCDNVQKVYKIIVQSQIRVMFNNFKLNTPKNIRCNKILLQRRITNHKQKTNLALRNNEGHERKF